MFMCCLRVLDFVQSARQRLARNIYALALYEDPVATLDDLREVVTTFEDTERTARRVLGGAHPLTSAIEFAQDELRDARAARAALRAREMAPSGSA